MGRMKRIFRWAAAVIVAVLITYLRVTGYLPESGPETESTQETESSHTAEIDQVGESSLLTRDGFCRTTYALER